MVEAVELEAKRPTVPQVKISTSYYMSGKLLSAEELKLGFWKLNEGDSGVFDQKENILTSDKMQNATKPQYTNLSLLFDIFWRDTNTFM